MKGWVRAGICFSLAILLIHLLLTKEMALFVNPRLHWLSALSVLLLILLGLVQLWHLRGKELHPIGGWGYALLFLPLLLYLMAPPKALDASVAAKKGVSYGKAQSVVKQQPAQKQGDAVGAEKPPEGAAAGDGQGEIIPAEDPYKKMVPKLKQKPELVLDEKNYAEIYSAVHFYPQEFEGKKIRVKGFVYRDDTLKKNEFVTGRFTVSCCTADATVIGFLTESDQASALKINEWVEAVGILRVRKVDGIDMPAIELTSYKKVEPLKNPYIYLY